MEAAAVGVMAAEVAAGKETMRREAEERTELTAPEDEESLRHYRRCPSDTHSRTINCYNVSWCHCQLQAHITNNG